MTAQLCGDSTLKFHNEVELTDHDIEQLLLEAETRLQGSRSKPDSGTGLLSTHNDHSQLPSLTIPKLTSDPSLKSYVHQLDDIALADTKRIIINPAEKGLSYKSARLSVQGFRNPSAQKEKPTAGADWFHLPKTDLTSDLKRDLQLIRMRSVLDPKRHYKKESGKAQPPKYSQVGTIIEGPTEFFSGRIAKRDRKKTFVEEALALERETKRFESRYRDVQSSKQSGKKSFYKNLRAKRNRRSK